jgi:hypothetical protein
LIDGNRGSAINPAALAKLALTTDNHRGNTKFNGFESFVCEQDGGGQGKKLGVARARGKLKKTILVVK